MPSVSPVGFAEVVPAATGPWQVLCGSLSALYHHCALWPAMVSVAPVAVMLSLSTVSWTGVVNCEAVASAVEQVLSL